MPSINNYEDEDELKLPEAEPAKTDYADILAQYENLRKSGDEEAASAQKMANFKNTVLNVGDGLSSALGGYGEAVSGGKVKADNNSAFFKDGIEQNNKKVAGIRAGTDQKIGDFLKQNSLKRDQVEQGQADELFGQKQKDFGYKESLRDPNAPKAASARAIISKQYKIDPAAMEDLGYEEILDFAKRHKDATSKGLTLTTTVDAQGRTVHAWADPATGQITPTGAEKGFALSVDQTTGQTISKSNPNQPTTAVVTSTGESLADVRTGLGGQRAEVNKVGAKTGELVVDYAKAEAAVPMYQEKAKRWTEMNKEARAAGASGPLSGRWADFKGKYGFEANKVSDEMSAQIQAWSNDYIKEVSGATVPDAEYEKRFKALIAARNMEPELFASKLAAFEQFLKDRAKGKKTELDTLRGQAGIKGTQSAPHVKEIKRTTKDGRTAVYNEAKEFLRYED